ncbi:MAG: hypothetical protein EXR79_10180 [Myxococcales bacterium]|nr:hypothetical protein [Myxococcales bacterium]
MSTRPHLPARWILFAVLALAAACSQDVGLIDRSQPGALDKRVFTGEWHYLRTVTDVPYTAGFTFIGEMEEMERVRWEIAEDRLIAYRSYDFIAGTDLDHGKRAKPGEKVHGQPVAIYKITGHFDLQREYSAATGEQTNVLVENDTDRPWYQRQYFRVDWSQNEVRNFLFTVDTMPAEPVKWAITDPTDPDAFTMAWRDANAATGWRESRDPILHREAKTADYLDVTTKVLATPGTRSGLDDSGMWSVPVCWFYLTEDCKPSEVKIRTSMRKIDPADDYEPLDYPDNYVARDKDGKAIHVRTNYDGSCEVDAKADAALRVPMFDKFGFFRAERYGYDPKYGEVESARKLMISRWNIWQKSKDAAGKPIPYAKRVPQPIVYHLGQGAPAEYVQDAKQLADEWDFAFRRTVAALQGKQPEAVPRMFEVRANTLKVDAKGVVTDRGQRVGDLRYSLLNVVAEPTRAGLLGYGPSATDPTTGQVIAAWANVYDGPTKELATTGRDLVRLQRGEIDADAWGLGEVAAAEVREAVQKALGGPVAKAKLEHDDDAPGKPAGSAAHAEFSSDAQAFAKKVATPERKALVKKLKKSALKDAGGKIAARMRAVEKHPELAARLVNRDLILAFGNAADRAMLKKLPPGAPMPALSKDQLDRLLPHAWAPLAARQRWVERKKFLLKHSITHAAFADDALLGVVDDLKAETDPEKLWLAIRRAVFLSTALHEVGHTLGLRHNFEGSSDALNYHSKYWELRGSKPAAPLADPDPTLLAKGMDDYKYSSIMDYAQRFHHDIKGLGPYDRAAIAFGYGQLVEVFEQKPADPAIDYLPLGRLLKVARHYTQIPAVIGSVAAISARKLVPYADVVAQRLVECQGDFKVPKRALFEVPYRFCSDEYLEGTPTCNVYDHGADPYEVVSANFARYRDHYVLYAFRRDRVGFSVDEFAGRMQGLFLPVAQMYQYWVADQNGWWYDSAYYDWDNLRWLASTAKPPKPTGVPDAEWEASPGGGLAATTAVRMGFERLAQIAATPEPGAYCKDDTTGLLEVMSESAASKTCDKVQGCKKHRASDLGCADAVVPLGRGRYDDTAFDVDTGYYFYDRLKYVGSYYEKVMALLVLSDPETSFIGKDSSLSLNNFMLPLNLYFAPELHRLFGGMAAGRQDWIGWVRTDNGKVKERAWFNAKDVAAHAKLPVFAMPDMFMLRDYAMFFGMATFNALLDQTFNDSMKVYVEGGGEAFTPAAGANVATFTNPMNNKVYRAVEMPQADLVSPAFTMVKDAQGLADTWTKDKKDGYAKYLLQDAVQFIELARGYADAFGYAWF